MLKDADTDFEEVIFLDICIYVYIYMIYVIVFSYIRYSHICFNLHIR